MPFTFAHPAAAVPLLRPLGRHAVLSALVIGSLAPDFSYFLPFRVGRMSSHSLLGLFWFCLPAGLLAYAVFHVLLARPLADVLPARLRERCHAALASGARRHRLSAVVVSIFAGALTHVAWDAFTHAGAPIVRVSRTLRLHLWTLSGYPISVYTILQHASTLAGLALLAYWIARWQRQPAPAAPPPPFSMGARARGLAVSAIVAIALVLWLDSGALTAPRGETLRSVQLWTRRTVPAAIASLAVSTLPYAAIWQLAARRRREAAEGGARVCSRA
jgi:hypothetical protein